MLNQTILTHGLYIQSGISYVTQVLKGISDFKLMMLIWIWTLLLVELMAEELPFIPGYDYNKMLQPDFSVEEYMAEHKKYKHIHIKQFKERFNKQIKRYEKDFEWTHNMAS